MKDSAKYAKIVEWSEEDRCYVGSAPGLIFGDCHGDDERAVFAELCDKHRGRTRMPVSMTPTANHFDDSIDGIRAKVADPFSRQVIEGAAHAFHSEGNPLRATFFSTAMRILFEHLMDTLAPLDRVRDCVWFQAQTENGRPTRRQRIMYAIQGGLTDEFVKKELGVDPEPLRKALLAAIDALSKHVHGRETSIITKRAEQDAFAQATLEEMEAFLNAMPQRIARPGL